MLHNSLFISGEEYFSIKNSPSINIDGSNISIEFLKQILSNDKYYNYIEKYFNDEIDKIVLKYNDSYLYLKYTKSQIIKAIQTLKITNEIGLSDKLNRYTFLKQKILFSNFYNKNKNDTYNIIIDGIIYNISVLKIIDFMLLKNEYFNNICNNNIKKIYNIPKEHFVYACINYFNQNSLINNYLLPQVMIENYNNILKYKIDIQSINKYNENNIPNVFINEKLKNSIFEDMPNFLNILEKSIYIYIKMCKLLTYDYTYYIYDQEGDECLKHKDINYINNITPSNNGIVCFQFNLIFSSFLKELGLGFLYNYPNSINTSYGESHVSLTYRVNKYIIHADSVESIFYGDLTNVKLGESITGLRCINTNKDTVIEFNDSLTKVYNCILSEMNDFDYLLDKRQNYDLISYDIKEKLNMIISKINDAGFNEIDSISYLLRLKKILLNNIEKEKLDMFIIRNNILSKVLIIFLVNNSEYYLYDLHNNLVSIPYSKLKYNFDNNIFGYIRESDRRISDISFINKKLIKA